MFQLTKQLNFFTFFLYLLGILTVKTATHRVSNMNIFEDLYLSKGGGLEASLFPHARISLVFFLPMAAAVVVVVVVVIKNFFFFSDICNM